MKKTLFFKKGKYLQKSFVLVPGFMQFVQSVPVAEVLATEGNIQVTRVLDTIRTTEDYM